MPDTIRINVRMRTKDPALRWREFDAELTQTPGIVLVQHPGHGMWAIIHKYSGVSLLELYTHQDARSIADQLKDTDCDWTRPFHDIKYDGTANAALRPHIIAHGADKFRKRPPFKQ